MSIYNTDALNYKAGAVTALANMAMLGASKKQVFEVAEIMDITFDDIDECDKAELLKAFGSLQV